MGQDFFIGISNEIIKKHKKRNRKILLMDKLKDYHKPNIIDLELDLFFSEDHLKRTYIFPFEDTLYCLIHKKKKNLIEEGTIKYNSIDQFGGVTTTEYLMIEEINNNDPVYQTLSGFISIPFFLFEIPFYFIPNVKGIYQSSLDSDINYELKIHQKILDRNNYLDFEVYKTFDLRSYQSNAFNFWKENQNIGTIAMATGGGKTIIGIQSILHLKMTALIVVPTIPLAKQWRKDLAKFLAIDQSKIGLFYGKSKEIEKRILIGTYNSVEKYIAFHKSDLLELKKRYTGPKLNAKIKLRKKISDYLQNYYSLLILDECHHIPAPTFKRVSLNSKALNRLALSATIKRYDNNESLIYFSCGKLVYSIGFVKLCELGYIVPFVHRTIKCPLTESQKERYILAGRNRMKKKRISSFTYSKLVHIAEISKIHAERNDKILIFASFVKSVKNIHDTLKNEGIKVGCILSTLNQKKVSKYTRQETIKRFKTSKISVLISTTVLDEGFNVPDCSVAIICSGTSNPTQLIQRIGRVVRSRKGIAKIGYIYEIVSTMEEKFTSDHKNYINRNQMVDKKDYGEYLETGKTKKPEEWSLNYEKIEEIAMEIKNNKNIEIVKYKG